MAAKPDPFYQILSLSTAERIALMTFLKTSAEGAGKSAEDEVRYLEDMLLLNHRTDGHRAGKR